MFTRRNKQTIPFACYPLDYSFCMLRDRAFEEVYARMGVKKEHGPGMDENGVLQRPKAGVSLGEGLLGAGRTSAVWRDIYQNRRMGTIAIKEVQEILQKLERTDFTGVLQEDPCSRYAGYLEEIHQALTTLEEACVSRAVIPSGLLRGKLTRAARRADRRWSADVFLADLPGRENRIRTQMKELTDRTDILFGFSEDLRDGMELGELMEKYPSAGDEFVRFLRANGYRAEPGGCWIEARSWSEDPQQLLETMRPLYRAKRERKPAAQEGGVSYPQVLGTLRRAVGESSFEKLRPYIDFYRFAAACIEETRYLEEGFYMQLRRLWPGLCSAVGGERGEGDDLKYLLYEELLEACRAGRTSAEAEEKIRERKAHRPEAVEKWESGAKDRKRQKRRSRE